MPKYLSQGWFDRVQELAIAQPIPPGAAAQNVSAKVQCLVTGGPEGDVEYTRVVKDGKLIQSALGRLVDPELTFTFSYEDGVRLQKGELETSVAYMQGKLKVAGDLEKLIPLLQLTQRLLADEIQLQIRQITEY